MLRAFWRDPIANGLLLSISLHLAVLALVQPAPGGGGAQSVVISARLVSAETPKPASDSQLGPESQPPKPSAPIVEVKPAVVPPVKPLPLLTSNVPSPAPPLPVAPAKVEPPVVVPNAIANPVPAVVMAPPLPVQPAHNVEGPVAVANSTTSAPFSVGIDTNWYLARQVDVHARALDSVQPVYPEEAHRRGLEGTLKLMLKIDDLGHVRDVEVVEADYPGVFDAAAVEAFKNARFQPALKDGRPVRYQAFIRVVFKLHD
jgi:protein TonB